MSEQIAVQQNSADTIVDVVGTPNALATPRVEREDRPDGSFVLRNAEPLQEPTRAVVDWLVEWAERTPDATFLAERVTTEAGRSWRKLSYAETLEAVRAIAQGLIDLDLDPERPVAVLSGNSINHALLTLGAMMSGRMIATVSVAYSLRTKTHDKLHAILEHMNPALIYAEDGELFGKAIESAGRDCPAVYSQNVRDGAIGFDELRAKAPTAAVDAAYQALTGDTIARLLLTSGSTGRPKLVINTHRMLCANQEMVVQGWRFLEQTKPVVLDWLPWSHTFGANHNFNMILRNGGTLYIDDGAPMPGMVERTVENLKDVKPTLYFNVPRGFGLLVELLEQDREAAEALFERLQVLFYAAAALPSSLWQRLEQLAESVREEQVFFASAWGATETSPLVTQVHYRIDRAGNIGIPVPGMELKFVPSGDKLEMRVRGDSVFPGYRHDEAKTQAAFDEEGFYRIGDAGVLADPEDPAGGVMFNGRVAEDFKLTSGTWVSVGTLGVRAVAALSPYAQDVVVAGHDRDEVGLLVFPTPALRALAGDTDDTLSGEALAEHPKVREAISAGLEKLAEGAGSSQCAGRAVLLSSPPDIDAGEITDKGYINQRAVLTRRADEVERLYSDAASVIKREG